MTRSIPRLLMVLLTVLAVVPATIPEAHAERWTPIPDASEIVFTSRAPLEKFKGRTRQVTGWVDFDPDDLSGPLACEITVDMSSLDTGKKKRNKHMRENHLETERFPVARFEGATVVSCSAPTLRSGSEATVRVAGTFDLHGVRRPLECDVILRRDANGTVSVATGFTVLLSDHEIPRPKFLVMKLADDQAVTIMLKLREGEGS